MIFTAMAVALVMLIVSPIIKENKKVSVNDNAVKVKVGKCRVFYPEKGDKALAKSLCGDGKEEKIIDYSYSKAGDYYKVSYPTGENYYMSDKGEVKVTSFSNEGYRVLSDYLRYEMKKAGREEYYTREFLENTYYENYVPGDIELKLKDENLEVYYKDYDIKALIPLGYVQEYIGMNLGFEDLGYYKPRYIDLNKPMVALTFDDGPSGTNDPPLLKLLETYDANATFFVVGNRLIPEAIEIIRQSIEIGNEYGSHSYDHTNLKNVSLSTGIWQADFPAESLKEELDYDVKLFRPPYGAYNAELRDNLPYTFVIWNIDSLDWSYKDFEKTYNEIMKDVTDKDVILMHDIHAATAVSVPQAIIPEMMEKGFQFVTVSELMKALGFTGKVFYGQ